ncbi:PREDICTED: uncharacterized protein LOC104698924 [Camelina sativa]|uniref:Uncharacterized protein LOC104698924 n=1 Tax=Camelina sativa TaxID=90675 RepID=A0ABM0SKS3_CAMSA|nr:PREDICTED: uncharacterized protein LOC104698924 [Camelina sativa]
MEKVELPVHEHPLFVFDRVCMDTCKGCGVYGYFYGGYICNELGCNTLFHKECVESVPEINHPSHPEHPLKLSLDCGQFCCSVCIHRSEVGYYCSICDFNVHLVCARPPSPSSISSTFSSLPTSIDNSKLHQHPLLLSEKVKTFLLERERNCEVCNTDININEQKLYECRFCNVLFHWECVGIIPDVYHTFHPKHPLELCRYGAPGYADEDCLLCGKKFDRRSYNCDQVYHCDVCNVAICKEYCMANPPPVSVVSPTTHEHKLHLVPRLVNFTCNACGTAGDRSPYFCLQCNFMIHRDCIDLPRVININRHNHRISYTRHLGHGNWTCGVCRKKVDGFYGAYSCSKCPSYAVHARCATRNGVWEKVELEGTPEEEELAPFEVVDENHIKHFSHGHNLTLNKAGKNIHESKLCEACVSQINDGPFYDCERCDFILHETCASLPKKIRNVSDNTPFTLQTDTSRRKCFACYQYFTGFKYKSGRITLDVRCSSIIEPFLHESHPHPLYYEVFSSKRGKKCSACDRTHVFISTLWCDECEFQLDFGCATLPRKVMNQRYDDHPLYLSYGETKEDGQLWCEACETKINPKEWSYACNLCGITLHVSCVVGDFSYHIPGHISLDDFSKGVVVPNTSICRPHCFRCSSRCKLPYILQVDGRYFCSIICVNPREY